MIIRSPWSQLFATHIFISMRVVATGDEAAGGYRDCRRCQVKRWGIMQFIAWDSCHASNEMLVLCPSRQGIMLPRIFRLSWMTKSHGAGIRRCHKLSVLFHVYQISWPFHEVPSAIFRSVFMLCKCLTWQQWFQSVAMIPIGSHKKSYPLMRLCSHHFQDCLG